MGAGKEVLSVVAGGLDATGVHPMAHGGKASATVRPSATGADGLRVDNPSLFCAGSGTIHATFSPSGRYSSRPSSRPSPEEPMTLRRPLSFLLTAALVTAVSPAARADWLDDRLASPLGPTDGDVPTAKKVVAITLMTGMVVSFATSFVFLAQANGAEGDRQDILRANGGITEGQNAQCTSAAQCSSLAQAKADRVDAKSTWETTMILGAGFATAALATMILWPNVAKEKPISVAPQASANGGGLAVVGSF